MPKYLAGTSEASSVLRVLLDGKPIDGVQACDTDAGYIILTTGKHDGENWKQTRLEGVVTVEIRPVIQECIDWLNALGHQANVSTDALLAKMKNSGAIKHHGHSVHWRALLEWKRQHKRLPL